MKERPSSGRPSTGVWDVPVCYQDITATVAKREMVLRYLFNRLAQLCNALLADFDFALRRLNDLFPTHK